MASNPDLKDEILPVVRVADLREPDTNRRWLVEELWTRAAVGFIAGSPKLGKTWLGLDLALSVATGTPCLGRYVVAEPGDALVYLAEDHPQEVRQRLSSLCRRRGLDVAEVPLNVITAPSLRLDLDKDRRRLHDTVRTLSPKLLLLDPLVRLHRRNENDAAEVSELLAYLRELQRTFDVAIAVVHHMRKNSGSGGGQALRGSGDFHAWTDSAIYLSRIRGGLSLRVEHRCAPSPNAIELELVSNDEDKSAQLEVKGDATVAAPDQTISEVPLSERVIELLRSEERPLLRADLRNRLRVNNERLGKILAALEKDGAVQHLAKGWTLATSPAPPRVPRSAFLSPPPVRGTERRNGRT